jgi:tetratricopeptide (TPR) repeat protein
MKKKNKLKVLLGLLGVLLSFNPVSASDYNEEAQHLLYEAYDTYLAGSFDKAVEQCRKVVVQHHGTKAADAAKKRIDFIKEKRAENEDALKIYIKAARAYRKEKYSEVISICTELNKKYPETSIVENSLNFIAASYREMKEYDKAIEVYQEISKKYPETETGIWSCYEIARIYNYKKRDYEKALKAYKKYIKLNRKEDNRLARSAIQNINMKLKRYDILEEDWVKAIKKDPKGTQAVYYHSQLINMYWKLKEYDKLVKQCEWVVRDFPGKEVAANALKNLGFYYYVIAKDKKKAYEYYDMLVKDYPQSHWAGLAKDDYEDLKDELISFPKAKSHLKQLGYLFQNYYRSNKEFPKDVEKVISPRQVDLLKDPYNPGYNYGYFHVDKRSVRLTGKRLEILITPEKIEFIREKK